MKNKYLIHILLYSLLLFALGCNLLFEEDIQDKYVTIKSPADQYVTTDPTLQFWWEEMEGAESYYLSISKFNNGGAANYYIDTNISGNTFNWSFTPGEYEWCITAKNSAYESKPVVWSFTVDSTLDLSGSSVIQTLPAEDGFTNRIVVELQWLPLYNATKYAVLIKDHNGLPVSPEIETSQTILTLPGISFTDTLSEGRYAWTIYASNDLTVSQSNSQYFTIDRTEPTVPNDLLPANNAIVVDSNITFSWQSGQDDHWAFDSLLIFNDPHLSSLKVGKLLQNASFQDSLGLGTYYWLVRSRDRAGNFSESQVNKLYVQ